MGHYRCLLYCREMSIVMFYYETEMNHMKSLKVCDKLGYLLKLGLYMHVCHLIYHGDKQTVVSHISYTTDN